MPALFSRHLDGPAGMRVVWKIAYPMIISTASHTVMIFCDRLFLSHLSREALAAALPAGFTSFVFMSLFFGTVNYVNALVAQYYGAGQYRKAGATPWQGVYLALLSYAVLLCLIPAGGALFRAVGTSAAVIRNEIPYFTILMCGSLFFLLNAALSSFFAGLGRTTIVMRANLTAMLVNLPLNAVLIFGLPENTLCNFAGVGIHGAAIASVIASGVGVLIFVWMFSREEFRERYATLRSWRLDREIMGRLLRLGGPAGIRFFFTLMALNLFVLMIGSIGVNEQAAINITFSWNLVVFLPLVGVSIATTTLVGQNVGACNMAVARQVVYAALKIAFLLVALVGIIYLAFPGYLVRVFGDANDPGFAEVYPLAKLLLVLAVFYKAADALMLVMEGALNGVGDTSFLMKVSFGLYWFLLVPPVTILVYYVKAGVVGTWLWFMMFSFVIALVYYARFRSGKWEAIAQVSDTCTLPHTDAEAEVLERAVAKHQ